jgi:hypothetical protein
MVKVYFENGCSSDLVATFNTEAMYMACLPALQQLADESGEFITESVEEYKIDFEHAIVAIMDAINSSDNVTQDEADMVLALIRKAKEENKY